MRWWPAGLLDATSAAQWSHDWGYAGEFSGQLIHFNRARVVGGCSAHNAGAVVSGSRSDYDGWAAAGNPRWSARELLPLFASAWALRDRDFVDYRADSALRAQIDVARAAAAP